MAKAAFSTIVDKIAGDQKKVDDAAKQIGAAFDKRVAFQKAKDSANTSIQRSLDKSRGKLVAGRAVAVLLGAEVTPDFLNAQTNEGSAYNVYAIDKVADMVQALDGGTIRNAINMAVCRSLFRFRAAKVPFTGECARAAASKQIRIQPASTEKLLVRHTVSPSTAPTQASSTMQALETLGIVKNTGTRRAAIYELTDTPQTKRLEEMVQAMAA